MNSNEQVNELIQKFIIDVIEKSDYYMYTEELESRIKDIINSQYKGLKNRCCGCKVDLGEDNPRQFCCKTYCPEYLEN
jgi:hypothetical protein